MKINHTLATAYFILCILGGSAQLVWSEEAPADPWEAVVRKNDSATVLRFARENPDGIKWHDEAGNTVLHCVVASPEIVAALLPLKPDIEARNVAGYRPLHFAVRSGKIGSIESLLAVGANVKARVAIDAMGEKTGETIMIEIAWVKEPEAVNAIASLLYAKDPSQLNAHGDLGFTPLMYAVDRGNLVFAKWLLAKGADKNAKNDSGETALESAKSRLAENKKLGSEPSADDVTIIDLLSK